MGVLRHGQIRKMFQPIVSLKNGSALGYEALSRSPKKTLQEKPPSLS